MRRDGGTPKKGLEARTIGESFCDPDAQRAMLDAANGYDAMADRAEAAEKLTKPIGSGKGGKDESSQCCRRLRCWGCFWPWR